MNDKATSDDQVPTQNVPPQEVPSVWPMIGSGGAAVLGAIGVYRSFSGLPAWPFMLAAGVFALVAMATSPQRSPTLPLASDEDKNVGK